MESEFFRAETDRPSYLPGENFTLRIFASGTLQELARRSGISVNMTLVTESRNHSAFGFACTPIIEGDVISITQPLPNELREGVYLVEGINLTPFNVAPHETEYFPLGPVFFIVRNVNCDATTPTELVQIVTNLISNRDSYMTKEIRTLQVTEGNNRACRVLIFGVGCLLHSRQQLEGFSITPLKRGFSHVRLHEIVNDTLSQLNIGPIPFDPNVEAKYEGATPTFLVDYVNVVSRGCKDALLHCQRHSALIFELLGLDRGHKPRAFFSIAIDSMSGEAWSDAFGPPHYRGNYLADFDQSASAALIEYAIPKLDADPFLRLIVRSYAEATAETDPSIALLRAWTVLELLAGRAIARDLPLIDPHGVTIRNKKGNPKTTSAAEGRVYKYVMDHGPIPWVMSYSENGEQRTILLGADEDEPNATAGSIYVSVWDVVRAAYAIRNCVAHEGFFSEDQIDESDADQVFAAHLIRNTPLDPRKWVQEAAKLAVHRALQLK